MEQAFVTAVLMIAALAAVIKFALFEWEGVVHAWMRVKELRKHTRINDNQLR
jgi:hypothetical protein